ncbi:hypothetical protein BpHYR1_025776 [Brachionus plicatilis]|uniref:Uncharacterized protein n=1 Tax=Brachionus plicatilis TaxID=10195 RepID=A0A3M7RVF2_BRAPC|nr:hypothetical protein BpHYR1_025776 [Brachionus plicatilis]
MVQGYGAFARITFEQLFYSRNQNVQLTYLSNYFFFQSATFLILQFPYVRKVCYLDFEKVVQNSDLGVLLNNALQKLYNKTVVFNSMVSMVLDLGIPVKRLSVNNLPKNSTIKLCSLGTILLFKLLSSLGKFNITRHAIKFFVLKIQYKGTL